MTLGEKVKLKREELNLSQEELAEKMNYKSKTSIHKIETGITDLPLSKVKELADVLKTTPAYLMGWEEDKKEEVKTAARNEKNFNKSFNKYSKLDPKKKKIVDDLINNLFDEMEDIEEEDIDVLK